MGFGMRYRVRREFSVGSLTAVPRPLLPVPHTPQVNGLTCTASYLLDDRSNHTEPRERGKIGVISGCPGREESVTDGAGRARLWPPAGPSSGWVGGKQNWVWFRRRIPTLWRVFTVFVLSKGNAASPPAFHLPTAKTIGPRVCDPTTFNPLA